MSESIVDRAAILDLTTYLFAENHLSAARVPSLAGLNDLLTGRSDSSRYAVYLDKIIKKDPSLGQIRVLESAADAEAVCYRDDFATYVRFRGTMNGGWTSSPTSLGSGFGLTDTGDGVSAKMQVEGLDFFDECVRKYIGRDYTGELVCGGHAQGGNVAEYVTMMSEHAALIDRCVSLDAPGHSYELRDYIWGLYGQDHFDAASAKIVSINGDNDYLNTLGQVRFARHIDYIAVDEDRAAADGQAGMAGWHDLLYLMDGETGQLMSRTARQGPIGLMMTDIVEAIKMLSPQSQADCALVMMGLFELTVGSGEWPEGIGLEAKDWASPPLPEETARLAAEGLPAFLGAAAKNPDLLAHYLDHVLPDETKERITLFLSAAPAAVSFALLVVGGLLLSGTHSLLEGLHDMIQLVDFIMMTTHGLGTLTSGEQQAFFAVCEALKRGFERMAGLFDTATSAGVRYATANPYFLVDTDRMNEYAARISYLNNRLQNLDRSMDHLFWQVGFLDLWDILVSNLLTGENRTLTKVKHYLENTASAFETAENKARGMMGG